MEPDTNSNQRRVIQASEILAKIERDEDVEYDDVIVEGDLDLSGLELQMWHVDREEFEVLSELSNWLKVIRSRINIISSEIRGNLNFNNAHFLKEICFEKSELSGNFEFQGSEFGGDADFHGAVFVDYANFQGVVFDGNVNFEGSEFGVDTNFLETEFSGYANFKAVNFAGHANFEWASFNGIYTNFERAEFIEAADFEGANFDRNTMSFKDAKFGDPWSQQVACRIAKRKMEDQGNKKEADYYFYREMEAVRLQNGIKGIKQENHQSPSNIREWMSLFGYKIAQILSKIKRFLIYDFLEYIFIQRVFGYGVRPFNVAKAWLIVVFTLGFVYWVGSGVEKANNTLEWYEYFYFSIVTAATPGYAGYTPASGLYTLIAGAQAIFGTFMWAAFIATFARKWQR